MSALVVPLFFPVPVAVSLRSYHEGGHTIVGSEVGAGVHYASVHEHGGVTSVDGSPRELLLCALAGNVAERLFGVHDSDVRCSRDDFAKAFKYAVAIAADEDGAALGSESFHAAAADLDPDEAAAALARRWVERAHVLVAEAELEVYGILNEHRRTLRRIAEGLELHGHLDAGEIAGLIEHDRRRSA